MRVKTWLSGSMLTRRNATQHVITYITITIYTNCFERLSLFLMYVLFWLLIFWNFDAGSQCPLFLQIHSMFLMQIRKRVKLRAKLCTATNRTKNIEWICMNFTNKYKTTIGDAILHTHNSSKRNKLAPIKNPFFGCVHFHWKT